MRLVILSILFLAINASAATAYRIIKVDLKTDSSYGTFVHNGKTFGAIVGASYAIEAVADDGSKTRFTSDFWLNNPLLSFPTLNAVKTAVRNDAISKKAKAQMESALLKNSVDAEPYIPVFGEDPGI